jgi:hypothetical protein
MSDSQQQSPNLGSAGYVWLLLAAAGTYFVVHQPPLEGTRPPTAETFLHERPSLQDVDSRLWQDPFAAVADKLASTSEFKPENCANSEEKNDAKPEAKKDDGNKNDVKKEDIKQHCASPLKDLNSPPVVLIASTSGAPYSEDHEYRRRLRYAILAGLSREGFVPRDPQHLGFFWPRQAISPAAASPGETPLRLPEVVPLEWLEGANGPALLLWFDEDVLGGSPLKQFDAFFCRALRLPESPGWDKAQVRVIGPELSTTLKKMAYENYQRNSADDCGKIQPHFYVYSATAYDATLIPKEPGSQVPQTSGSEAGFCPGGHDSLSKFFRDEKQVTLFRTTASDAALACMMDAELNLRRPHRVMNELFGWLPNAITTQLAEYELIDPPVRRDVVLISEWDTLYGESLPKVMAKALRRETKPDKEGKKEDNIHPYSYLRGLDGQMPNIDGLSSGNPAKGPDRGQDAGASGDNNGKDRLKVRSDAKPNDRAEGQGQFDYLRRLGDKIGELDARLRRERRDDIGIVAVGVLGSDLYDKLLILQALRPLLPNALFFTTDLDALVLHPMALPQTRNLLIASSFGLQLEPELQGEIPPFRSSYQSSAFFATRMALKRADTTPYAWTVPPLLFEVGLSGLFQFPPAGVSSKASKNPTPDTCLPLGCGIHQQPSDMYPKMGIRDAIAAAIALAVLGVGGALSCSPLSRPIWKKLDERLARSKRSFVLGAWAIGLSIGLLVIIGALTALIYLSWETIAHWFTGDGQPIIWLEGISIWPTIAMRAAILALCVLLSLHAYLWLDADFKKISQDMQMDATWKCIERNVRKLAAATTPWASMASFFSYQLPDGGEPACNPDGHLSNEVLRFWKVYIYQGLWKARICRTLVGVTALLVLWIFLELVFGNPPAPARGGLSFWFYAIVSGLLNVTALFLTIFVADTILLCWKVITSLRKEADTPWSEVTCVWPKATLDKFSNRVGLQCADLEHWIDLVFISKRTKCVTTLIYFPFIVVALLIVSRSRLFANYAPSLPEMIVMGVGLLIVTGSAIRLRQAAEASRAKANRRLNDQIMLARQAQGGEKRAAQLEMLLQRVQELHEGALTPFSQQPLLRAILLPLGTFGGTALAEYLLLPGLS